MSPADTITFFGNYFEELEAQGYRAVVLHTWKNLPKIIESDVDYLVGDITASELLRFLDRYCRQNGWLLAQAMEHEPGAFYCVCFMEESPWESLKLDVAWDYSRKGRMLLPGDFLLRNRVLPPEKPFHVPAAHAEFAYVLAKGLAKAKGPEPVIRRLQELWNQDREACAATLADYFQIRDLKPNGEFPENQLFAALQPGAFGFDRWRKRRWGWQQIRWLFRRLRRPYGLTVAVNPNFDREALAAILLPAFRRYHLIDSNESLNRLQRLKLEYQSGLLLLATNSTSSLASDILDLCAEQSLEICAKAVLRHLHGRGNWLTACDS